MYEILLNFDALPNDKVKKIVKDLHLDKLAQFVLETEDIKKGAAASITFVSVSTIHDMNKRYRGIDRPTDILSFECDGLNDDFMPSNQDEFELGDIFICYEIALSNSQNYNTSIESELKLLTVHGMLHICGYDHIEDHEARAMEKLEEKILDAWSSHEQQ